MYHSNFIASISWGRVFASNHGSSKGTDECIQINTQPLPDPLQQSIWTFVREEIRRYEGRVGAKVAEYELHLSGAGQIEIEVLATESANDAAIDEGLEETGSKAEVNRLDVRSRLAEEIEDQS
jgi:hypothetical protein